MSFVFRILILILSPLCFAGASFAQSSIGNAEVVVNKVNGSGVVGNRRLSTSDPVYGNENIISGNASRGELRLNDNSKLLVGPNSSIKLDNFVTGGNGFQSGTMQIAKGAMRFVTGRSNSSAFKVTTPLSTVGVRGTTFDVYVDGEEEYVVLFRGAVNVCSSSGCKLADRSCDVIRVSSDGDVKKLPHLKSRASGDSYDEQKFGLIFKQRDLQPRFRAPIYLCHFRSALNINQGGGEPGTDNPEEFLGEIEFREEEEQEEEEEEEEEQEEEEQEEEEEGENDGRDGEASPPSDR